LALPFLDKAFTIDDTVFLRLAEQILSEPLDPYGFEINWDGITRSALANFASPPLWGYLLAPAVAVGGGSELAVHLELLLWIALAAWGMERLARQFGLTDGTASLLYVTMPCFVVLGQTAMPDVPAAALALHGAAEVLRVHKGGDSRWPIASALLTTACLCRFNAVAVPLGLSCLVFAKNRSRTAVVGSLAVPIITTMAVVFLIRQSAGTEASIARHLMLWPDLDMARRAIAMFTHLGAATVFLPAFVLPFLCGRRRWLATLLAVTTAILLAILGQQVSTTAPVAGIVGLALPVAFCLWMLIFRIPRFAREFDKLDLALATWFVAAATVPLVYVQFAAKYLVIAAPPLILLLLRAAVRSRAGASARRWLRLCWVGGATLAIACSVSDYKFAGVYRAYVEERLPAVQVEVSGSVWFTGHWGWQWYMELAGALPFEAGKTRIGPDDALITVLIPSPVFLPREMPSYLHRTKEEPISPPFSFPIRLISPAAHAGFYSSGFGLLPIGFSHTPYDFFVVWRRKLEEDP
jgi:4-amino-4-deoxy-L-arabinose transferase-like glycosyltransferase